MRLPRLLPILALATTLGVLGFSAPFVEAAAAAAPLDKAKAKSKAKHRKANTTTPSPAPDPNRRAAGYRVNIEGAILTNITVSAVSDEVELVEQRNGSGSRTSTVSAGRFFVAEITLTGTGPIPRVVLDQWRAVKSGKPRKANVAIETLDAAGEMIYQHRLYNTLPRKLTISPGKDKWTITLAIEQVDLFH